MEPQSSSISSTMLSATGWRSSRCWLIGLVWGIEGRGRSYAHRFWLFCCWRWLWLAGRGGSWTAIYLSQCLLLWTVRPDIHPLRTRSWSVFLILSKKSTSFRIWADFWPRWQSLWSIRWAGIWHRDCIWAVLQSFSLWLRITLSGCIWVVLGSSFWHRDAVWPAISSMNCWGSRSLGCCSF